jgi:hypothetical protein
LRVCEAWIGTVSSIVGTAVPASSYLGSADAGIRRLRIATSHRPIGIGCTASHRIKTGDHSKKAGDRFHIDFYREGNLPRIGEHVRHSNRVDNAIDRLTIPWECP